ncbi:Y-family DNA polymerase [Streptococcus sobrinus]|uniref:Y-family DNA polymerase n=1 Tax=Streptococcus sobrinus TaxID=1310 RepID=UPI00031F72D7|nr:Y-family DNA polymerase [Streptococcus sobrinus]
MGYFDYSCEPRSDIAFVDMKSFYASVECVDHGLDPLKASLCVMSRADHTSGLILASSPTFKKVFGKSNVSRAYDLPFDVKTRKFSYHKAKKQGLPITPDFVNYIEAWAAATYIVPPRMELYIEKNLEIQHIFQNYASIEDILPYSIDEGFLDLTGSLNYFIPDKNLTKQEKLDQVSAMIQREIFHKTGIYSTVGMSNANPLLAKLALDNEAKYAANMRANWSYGDVESKVWSIPKLTDFWGIGRRMAKRLNKLGIQSIKQLANSNPDLLKRELGVSGVDLFFHANGIDESNVHQPYRPKERSLGNSQILPRDYQKQEEIELVLTEMAEQVAIRLRRARKKTTLVAIHLGYAKTGYGHRLQAQKTIEPSSSTKDLQAHVLNLFRQKYSGGAIRSIAVSYGHLIADGVQIISLFDDPSQLEKEEKLEIAIDAIRNRFGFTTLQRANALSPDSRALARSKLIGGHSAGGLDGLQ